MPAASRLPHRLLLALLSLVSTAACGPSDAEIAQAFAAIQKGDLAAAVAERLGQPEREESNPQIPDLVHWKYLNGRLTVSMLQGRVLGKFDAGSKDPRQPLPADPAQSAHQP